MKIRVTYDKLHILDTQVVHVVYCVASPATYTNHLNDGLVVLREIKLIFCVFHN